MTFAAAITLFRMLLTPLFIVGILHRAPGWPVWVFALCVLTDLLDGIVARRWSATSPLGAFLDPAADKLLLNAGFLVLAVQGRIPLWFFFIVLSRDLLIVLGWNLLHILTRRAEVRSRWFGKGATACQMLTVVFLLVPVLAPVRRAALLLTAVVTAFSGADYVLWGGKLLSRVG